MQADRYAIYNQKVQDTLKTAYKLKASALVGQATIKSNNSAELKKKRAALRKVQIANYAELNKKRKETYAKLRVAKRYSAAAYILEVKYQYFAANMNYITWQYWLREHRIKLWTVYRDRFDASMMTIKNTLQRMYLKLKKLNSGSTRGTQEQIDFAAAYNEVKKIRSAEYLNIVKLRKINQVRINKKAQKDRQGLVQKLHAIKMRH